MSEKEVIDCFTSNGKHISIYEDDNDEYKSGHIEREINNVYTAKNYRLDND